MLDGLVLLLLCAVLERGVIVIAGIPSSIPIQQKVTYSQGHVHMFLLAQTNGFTSVYSFVNGNI